MTDQPQSLFPETVEPIKTVTLLIDDLIVDQYGEKPVPALSKAIASLGMLYQPVVQKVPGTDKYRVLDGRRRAIDARNRGEREIECRLVNPYINSSAVSLIAHATRRDNPAMELMEVNNLIRRGLDEQAICAETGMNPQTIRRRLRLNRLIPVLKSAFLNGDIGVTVAEACAKCHEAQQSELVPLLGDPGRITLKDVARVRQVAKAEAAEQASLDGLWDDLPEEAPSGSDPSGSDPELEGDAAILWEALEVARDHILRGDLVEASRVMYGALDAIN